MISYKDRTYCLDESCKNFKDCPRAFTEEDSKSAHLWWGGDDPPISIYMHRLECYEAND